MENYFKLRPVVQKEMAFKEVYARWTRHNAQRPITMAHLDPLAQVN